MNNSKSRSKARDALDERLGPLRPVDQWAQPRTGWIKAIRNALGMTSAELGRRLSITAAGVRSLEISEAAGTIKVATLRRAADAMDCDLVVIMVPRVGLNATVQTRADAVLAAIEERVEQTMALEDQSVQQLPSWRRARRDELIESGHLWQDVQT